MLLVLVTSVVFVVADSADCCCCEEKREKKVVIRGLDKKKRWRKKTVPLVQLPAFSGFVIGLYQKVGRRGSAGPLSSLSFFVGGMV